MVAVSGGADSLCLLGMLHEQGYSLIVAHFDHQLRPDSADDAKFVEEIASRYQLPFLLGRADINIYAKEHKETIEEAARNARYAFFFEQARLHQAQAVAVGHTAEDQVETVLMHFLRGAGLSGLKGILPRTILPHFDPEIPLVRPILHLRRTETEDWCAQHNLVPLEDPTNASLAHFRNRLRHHLIPELEKYNPRLRAVLTRTSQALQGDYALLEEIITQSWQQVVKNESKVHLSFSLSSFAELSPALIRNLIKKGMEQLLPGQTDISYSVLERAAQFISSPDSAQRVDLASGLFLLKEQDALHLTSDLANLPIGIYPQFCGETKVVLARDGVLALDEDWHLTIKSLSHAPKPIDADPFQVMLDADALGGELSLRARQAGDRFRPLGLEGKSIKLKDFFINEKLPQRARHCYPLLCAGNEIVWVPGFRPAHHVRITEATRSVVFLSLKKGEHSL